ncbi:MAG TPA: TolC family protein [Candidatus Handelsmanbacteria bacterium]|nr:TolC family protein [Candidatus Handelsmanbacteria bacterium]
MKQDSTAADGLAGMRRILLLLVGLLHVTGTTLVAEVAALQQDELIDEALANNPTLAALRSRAQAAQERVPQAGALMDPMLRLELSNVPLSDFDFDSTPMTGKQLTLSQRFPWWGKLATRQRMASHAVGVIEATYDDRVLTVTNMVRQAYYSLAFVDRATQILTENQQLLADFVHIAQTKYAVGHGLQQDVLRAQLSLSTLDDRLIVRRQERGAVEAHLNSVLNRPPQSRLGLTGDVKLSSFHLSADSLQQMALASHPALRAIDQTQQRWAAAAVLADRQRRPDIDLIAGYRQRDRMPMDAVQGSDLVTLGFSINLPIYQDRKQDRQEAEARHEQRAAMADREALTQQIFATIQRLSVDARAHRDRARLLRTAIIPQANQSLTSALAGYEVHKVDFLDLLNDQVTLFNYEIDVFRHITDFEKTLADLEAIVGQAITDR